MKKLGIVIDYDGYNGSVISLEDYKRYLIMSKDIVNKKYTNIKKGDIVEFDSELFKEKKLIARFIEKQDKIHK